VTDAVNSVVFGFYPRAFDIAVGSISIATLPNLDATVQAIASSQFTENNWIYAPPQETRHFPSGVITTRPYRARVFGLPKTHRLTHSQAQDPAHLRFLCWCFGFFAGMRMSDTEAGFLDATPIKPGTAHDFLCSEDTLTLMLGHAERFWNAHSENPRIEAAMRGIIHSYFMSQTPTLLDFERFIYLYTALDGCHCVNALINGLPTNGSHKERIAKICDHFSIAVPKWVDSVTPTRNATLHEGLFFNEPLGFQIFGGSDRAKNADQNLLLQMEALSSRLIVALLGMADNTYVRSPINTRQIHSLHLSAD
jgi:hypothetical protein